jgi:hypothetical protein
VAALYAVDVFPAVGSADQRAWRWPSNSGDAMQNLTLL